MESNVFVFANSDHLGQLILTMQTCRCYFQSDMEIVGVSSVCKIY